VREGEIELYAGETRQQISALNMTEYWYLFWLAASARLYRVATLSGLGAQNRITGLRGAQKIRTPCSRVATARRIARAWNEILRGRVSNRKSFAGTLLDCPMYEHRRQSTSNGNPSVDRPSRIRREYYFGLPKAQKGCNAYSLRCAATKSTPYLVIFSARLLRFRPRI